MQWRNTRLQDTQNPDKKNKQTGPYTQEATLSDCLLKEKIVKGLSPESKGPQGS